LTNRCHFPPFSWKKYRLLFSVTNFKSYRRYRPVTENSNGDTNSNDARYRYVQPCKWVTNQLFIFSQSLVLKTKNNIVPSLVSTISSEPKETEERELTQFKVWYTKFGFMPRNTSLQYIYIYIYGGMLYYSPLSP